MIAKRTEIMGVGEGGSDVTVEVEVETTAWIGVVGDVIMDAVGAAGEAVGEQAASTISRNHIIQ